MEFGFLNFKREIGLLVGISNIINLIKFLNSKHIVFKTFRDYIKKAC